MDADGNEPNQDNLDQQANNQPSISVTPNDNIPVNNKNKKLLIKFSIFLSIILTMSLIITTFYFIAQKKNSTDLMKNEVQKITPEKIVFDEQEIIEKKDTLYTKNHKIYSMDLTGNKKLLYSYTAEEKYGAESQISITKNNELYVQGPVASQTNKTINQAGEVISKTNDLCVTNQTGEVISKTNDFYDSINCLTSKDNNQIITSEPQLQALTKTINIKDLTTNKSTSVNVFTSSTVNKGDLSLLGWSKADNIMYVKLAYIEGLQLSKLWRVNTITKNVEIINIVTDAGIWSLSVYPELDLALGLGVGALSDGDTLDTTAAPSKLFLIDLKNNTKKQIASSNDNIIFNFHLSSDGQKVLYQERGRHEYSFVRGSDGSNDYISQPSRILSTKLLDLNTNKTTDYNINKNIDFCSSDLRMVLLGSSDFEHPVKNSINLFDLNKNKSIIDLNASTTNYSDRKVGDKFYIYIGFFNKEFNKTKNKTICDIF